MSHRLKPVIPLPPDAELEVIRLFLVWQKHHFPDGNMYDDVGHHIEVPFPKLELDEIDRRFGLLENVNRNQIQITAKSFFIELRDQAAFEHWDHKRKRARRKKVLKIVLLVLIAVCVVWGIYSNM